MIVIGVGSMGSAACYYLAKNGYRVLGLEQFDITHELGSHAGQSRIIRKSYFEHPDYVPLMERAYHNWKELEKATGVKLYYKTGLLYGGNAANEIIKGVKHSAGLYNIELEELNAGSMTSRFPQFSFPKNFDILFEPDAGFLLPERSIQLLAEQAGKKGAIIHSYEKVIAWKKEGNGVKVKTDINIYQANQLVITAGAWSGKLIPAVADKIKVTRQCVAWIKTRPTGSSGRAKNYSQFELNNFPCWMIGDDDKQGCYYGFPSLDTKKFGEPAGLKLAHHFPSQETDPDKVNRQVTKDDIENLRYCLEKYLPGAFDSVLHTKICLYSNSPDENFIIDRLPGYEEYVSIACGFSGHGFKFVSVVGEILADLAMNGKTNLPIEFLNAQRFA